MILFSSQCQSQSRLDATTKTWYIYIKKKEKKRASALRDLAGNLLFVELIYCYKDIIIYIFLLNTCDKIVIFQKVLLVNLLIFFFGVFTFHNF